MRNKFSSVLLCGLASLLLLAHTIMPHEHRIGGHEVTHPHCSAFQVPSDCCSTGNAHFHAGKDTHHLELCAFTNVITNREFPANKALEKIILKLKFHSLQTAGLIENTANATYYPLGGNRIHLGSPPATSTRMDLSLPGLRAPPIG